MSLPGASAKSKRAIVLHEDDVGMCHGANAAYLELTRLGTCSSGSVMVPCPWFLEVAEAFAADPGLDLGVHVTLNSEKRFYKWRPLTRPSAAAGLTDEFGFFWPDVATTRAKAAPEAVEAEIRAQIDMAYQAGIDPTHLDAHMGAAIAPEFSEIFVRIAREYQLPVMITSTIAAYAPNDNLAGVTEEEFRPGVDLARKLGFPIFESALQTTWGRAPGDPGPAYRALLEGLAEGLNYFCLHFNAPGELEAIEPGTQHLRVEEYLLFQNAGFRDWLARQDIEVIGMRPLRDALRAQWAGEKGHA